MVLQSLQAILSSVSNVVSCAISVTQCGLIFMHHGFLQSLRRFVDHVHSSFVILEDAFTAFIPFMNSDIKRTSELAARHACLHKWYNLIDCIEELLKHLVGEPTSLESSQLSATSCALLRRIFRSAHRTTQRRHQPTLQRLSTYSITASTINTINNDVPRAAQTLVLPQIQSLSLAPSCPIATERYCAPSESSMVPTATHVTEVVLRLAQSTLEEIDSVLRVSREREGDQNPIICQPRCRNYAPYPSTSLPVLTNPLSSSSSTQSDYRDRTESSAAFHSSVQSSTYRCCTRSSHCLYNSHSSSPQGLLLALSDKGCGIKEDYSLCRHIALFPCTVYCTIPECKVSKGRHKNHKEKSLDDDTANLKAPFSSPSSSSTVAQSIYAGRHLLHWERHSEDDIANLPAPSSSSKSFTVAPTSFLSRHNTYHLYKSTDDDTANPPAPYPSLSFSSTSSQSTLIPDISPATQSQCSGTLSTSSLAGRYPLFPSTGHSATAMVERYSTELGRTPCRATVTIPRQESKHPTPSDTSTLGNGSGQTRSARVVNLVPRTTPLMGFLPTAVSLCEIHQLTTWDWDCDRTLDFSGKLPPRTTGSNATLFPSSVDLIDIPGCMQQPNNPTLLTCDDSNPFHFRGERNSQTRILDIKLNRLPILRNPGEQLQCSALVGPAFPKATAINLPHQDQRPINAVNWETPAWESFPSKTTSMGRSPLDLYDAFFRDFVANQHYSAAPSLLVHRDSVASSPDNLLASFRENGDLSKGPSVIGIHSDVPPKPKKQIAEGYHQIHCPGQLYVSVRLLHRTPSCAFVKELILTLTLSATTPRMLLLRCHLRRGPSGHLSQFPTSTVGMSILSAGSSSSSSLRGRTSRKWTWLELQHQVIN